MDSLATEFASDETVRFGIYKTCIAKWRGWLGSRLVLEVAMDGLHVSEDALPVGLAHRHHVVDVQQRVDARLLTGTFTKTLRVYV